MTPSRLMPHSEGMSVYSGILWNRRSSNPAPWTSSGQVCKTRQARALFDQLKADDIPDERCAELLSALAHACDPDMALSNFVDIVNAMQSSQRDLEHVIPDNDA